MNNQNNMWSQIAKKAITEHDLAITNSQEAKKKAEIAYKKKKDREAYLERKARREQRAKEKKVRDDANYELYKLHMLYLHGSRWFYMFDECGDKSREIPAPFFDRVQEEIQEDQGRIDRFEYESMKNIEAEEMKMKATLSPAEYQDWEDDENNKCLDTWFYEDSLSSWNERKNQEAGKRWLEEQLLRGNIVLGKDGKYRYYADL